MSMKSLTESRSLLLVLLFLFLVGCNADDSVSPDSRGTIVVTPSPESPDAPWSLTGPESYSTNGAGAQTLRRLVPGDYTFSWIDDSGLRLPRYETRAVAAGAITIFIRTSGAKTGKILIDCTPETIAAPWQMLGPNGFSQSGFGDLLLTDMRAGEYWVSWGSVAGWIAPGGLSQTLAPDTKLTFVGTYTEGPQLPFPATENQLMANFRTVYEDRNFAFMPELLHPDFITILQASTTEEFPDVGQTLDLAEELRIAERMFAGQPVTDPDGNLVPGISDIWFYILEQLGTWETSSPTDVIPNARFALFDVGVWFSRVGYSTLKVEGQIKFYAVGRDSLHEGVNRTYFEMIGQQDLTNNGLKAVEAVSWGTVKALFR